ncbi:MAG: DUF1648 domain-containing protein [Proteobacteria bacterium]|nr:DUF1648 domain-containing protein [Pseudomonadota bacterium]
MKPSTASPALLLPLALAALYVWYSSRALPAVVATHFGANGAANGYMTHANYLRFMLAFVVLLPWLVNFVMERALAVPGARINLPNRDHWLSESQRASTIDYLLRHMRFFSLMLTAFLCAMHSLVVGANAAAPPALDNKRFSIALGAYLLVIVLWIVALRRHFRRPPVSA